MTRDNEFITPGKDFFYTDAIAENASTFIEEHDTSKDATPFFMYVAFTAPHWPMHARPHNMKKYKGKYDVGWDAIRKARHDRQLKMGLIDPDWKMTPRDERSWDWDDSSKLAEREWHIRNMEVYAAMVDCLDQGVGRILDSLKKTDELENTLVMFFADNGRVCREYGVGRWREISRPGFQEPQADETR